MQNFSRINPLILPLAFQQDNYNVSSLSVWNTLMCLSIGTPKNNKFSICSKWKIHYFQVSQNLGRVQPHYNVLKYLGHVKTMNFPFETNGKLMILGVPILKHFRVSVLLKFFNLPNKSLTAFTILAHFFCMEELSPSNGVFSVWSTTGKTAAACLLWWILSCEKTSSS